MAESIVWDFSDERATVFNDRPPNRTTAEIRSKVFIDPSFFESKVSGVP